ncbi:MAG: ABC transporter ATP-binding protein [Micrococcales bacterium]|nr:ABC transporter ATP-binding protein [Micrococcales bacterium]MCL2668833.1 ABC transporter ATP-binding protein [Micrococcales bacterium]
MDEVLQVRGLHKKFGRGSRTVHANAGVDLDVGAGQVVGLLGHNGAGKSTLVNQVVGLLRPDAGTIMLAGTDAVAHPDDARRLVSVQAQANVPITGLTPRTAIELVGRIRGGQTDAVRTRTAHLIEALDLGEWAGTPAEKVSGGVARLTAFAMAAVAPGRLVVLDEPTNDVDPVRRRLLWRQIRALADDGAGVLLVTHNVREAERVVDRLVVLDRGVVLADDTPAALTQSRSGTLTLEVDLVPAGPPPWPVALVVTDHGQGRATAEVPVDEAAAVVAWAGEALAAGQIERYALTPASLEDVYIALVEPEAVP